MNLFPEILKFKCGTQTILSYLTRIKAEIYSIFQNKAKGGIYFHSISEVYVDHQNAKSVTQRVTFCMKTNDRKYYLMAPSPEAMRIWVDVLFTGAEGYQEFQE